MPTYATAPFNEQNPGIRRWSMGNVAAGSDMLWTSWTCAYFFTLLFLFLLNLEYREFAKLRQKYFKGSMGTASQASYSVLVEGIPKKYRTHKKLKAFFDKLFPYAVHSVAIPFTAAKLQERFDERLSTIKQLEVAVGKSEAAGGCTVRLNGKGRPSMFGCRKVDLVPFLQGEVARLDGEVDALQAEVRKEMDLEVVLGVATNVLKWEDRANANADARRNSKVAEQAGTDLEMQNSDPVGIQSTAEQQDTHGENISKEKKLPEKQQKYNLEEEEKVDKKDTSPRLSSTGFVTFISRRSHTAAYQLSILDDDFPAFRAYQAPERDGIIMSNLSTPASVISFNCWISALLLGSGVAFWALIIAFIATISQLAFLGQYLPFVKDLDPLSYSILAGVLPVVILSIFLGILPILFKLVAVYFERRKTEGDVQRMVFGWYFAYLLANVYLTLLSGSLASTFSTVAANPASVVDMLGASLPAVSLFFINYLISQVFLGIPLLLLRIAPLVKWNVFLRLTNQKKLTRRQLQEGPLADQMLDYGTTTPLIMYIILIVQLYWVITPLITIIAIAYFGGLYTAYKYQLLYIFVPKTESGGQLWYAVYYRLNVGLLVASIAMISYMGIKLGPAQTTLLIPLPFIIVIAWLFTESQYLQLSLNMSYSQASVIDSDTKHMAALKLSFTDNFYRQECVSAPHGQVLPHREGDVPLLDEKGELSKVYQIDKKAVFVSKKRLSASASNPVSEGVPVKLGAAARMWAQVVGPSAPEKRESYKLAETPTDSSPATATADTPAPPRNIAPTATTAAADTSAMAPPASAASDDNA